MSQIDWPLAAGLGVIFVVTSIVRWRYFNAAAKRWTAKRPAPERPTGPPR